MSDLLHFTPVRAVDLNNVQVPGALAYFYRGGTSTPETVYADAACTIPHPRPLVANGEGVFPACFSLAAYGLKVDVKNPAGVSLTGYPMDPVIKVTATAAGASSISFSPSDAVPQTNVQSAIDYLAGLVSRVAAGTSVGRFAQLRARMAAGETVKIACYGDSTTEGVATSTWTAANPVDGFGNATGAGAYTNTTAWPALAQSVARSMHQNSNIQFWNAGYAGRRLYDGWAASNFNKAIVTNPGYGIPDAVIVQFGLNDVGQAGFTIKQFETQLLELCVLIFDQGAFPIFMTPDATITTTKNSGHTQTVRDIYRRVGAQYGIEVIDWCEASQDVFSASMSNGRWADDMSDATHGEDAYNRIKGAFVAAKLYANTLWLGGDDVYDIAPWSGYVQSNLMDSYSLAASVYNKFGGSRTITAGAFATGQQLMNMWVWSTGAARNLYWMAIDSDNFLYPRTRTDAPKISTYNYWEGVTSDRYSPHAGFTANSGGTRAAESPGIIGTLGSGLTRVIYTAPTDSTATQIYLGYFSIRKKPKMVTSSKLLATVASATVFDPDPYMSSVDIASFGTGIDLTMNFSAALPSTCGVFLWASRIWGTGTSLATNDKRGLLLYRSTTNVTLYDTVFQADGTVVSSTSLGTAAVTWSDDTRFRLRARGSGSGQTIELFTDLTTATAAITVSVALASSPLSWGGTPGAIYQGAGATGFASLTVHQIDARVV